MTRFTHFLAHNNLIPIALSVVLLGAGTTYASQNPERIYAVEDRVVAIDNTYLVNLDLDTFSPTVQIADVTEDDDAFYVSYDLATVALVDSVWQDTTKTRTLTVHKDTLADYRDLGAFVTTQLQHLIDRELTHLQKVQEYEQRRVSHKQITTSHSGLVGMFMDDTTETLPPHTKEEEPEPVPPPRTTEEPERTQPAAAESDTTPTTASAPDTETESATSEGSAQQPYLALLGQPTIELELGATYTEMGVVIHDTPHTTPELHTMQNGTEVDTVAIDTTATSSHTVTYILSVDNEVVDEVERQILVVEQKSDSPLPGAEEESDPSTDDAHTTTTPTNGSGDSAAAEEYDTTTEADETEDPSSTDTTEEPVDEQTSTSSESTPETDTESDAETDSETPSDNEDTTEEDDTTSEQPDEPAGQEEESDADDTTDTEPEETENPTEEQPGTDNGTTTDETDV